MSRKRNTLEAHTKRLAATIRDNSERYHRRELDHDEFTRRQRAAWDDAEALGVADAVRAELRAYREQR